MIERKSPRKGTKSRLCYIRLFRVGGLLKESPQERGRKDLLHRYRWFHGSFRLKESPQERGRKDVDCFPLPFVSECNWKKVPKKGDEKVIFSIVCSSLSYWKKVPKKGDEKNLFCRSNVDRHVVIERKSPRKGTKSFYHLPYHPWCLLIERKSPRKGTKRAIPAYPRGMRLIERKSPRKGTKRSDAVQVSIIALDSIERKSPRKGTKSLRRLSGLAQLLLDWKKVPKKGDEKTFFRFFFSVVLIALKESPQERGRKGWHRSSATSHLCTNWKKVPKKGDEKGEFFINGDDDRRIERKSPRKGTKSYHGICRWTQ